MTEHPNAVRLEEFAAGDPASAETQEHVSRCEVCRDQVARLRQAARQFAERQGERAPEQFVAAVLTRRTRELRRARGHVLVWSAGVAAVAAGSVLWLLRPGDPHGPQPTPTPLALAPLDTTVRFKGRPQLAVILERSGQQRRLTTRLRVRADDRIRAEISVDGLGTVEVGVLSHAGEWASLLPPQTLAPGTHLSPQSVRFDAGSQAGWVIAGTPDAVVRARTSHDFVGVAVIPLEIEPMP